VLTLYQAEWCPYSGAVRQRLTELGVDFLARQVPPWPEQREELLAATGQSSIPALLTDDGRPVAGVEAILAYLSDRHGAREADQRQRYAEHRSERREETTASVLAQLAPIEEGT
jgi:glutathione S-transferase